LGEVDRNAQVSETAPTLPTAQTSGSRPVPLLLSRIIPGFKGLGSEPKNCTNAEHFPLPDENRAKGPTILSEN
jgi:hypothetical protein